MGKSFKSTETAGLQTPHPLTNHLHNHSQSATSERERESLNNLRMNKLKHVLSQGQEHNFHRSPIIVTSRLVLDILYN
jgi:hypothetical protein